MLREMGEKALAAIHRAVPHPKAVEWLAKEPATRGEAEASAAMRQGRADRS